ncbi:MAG: cytochrome ubiquinol oxidase subunit I [Nitrospinae bacterium]|nr:cytochrome ubiquinol oxidase subunit I [Nitrospinota bacterium]
MQRSLFKKSSPCLRPAGTSLLLITHCSLLIAVFCLLPTDIFAGSKMPATEELSFPLIGNRTIIWIIAQFHILFASFILGVPLFVVISEFLYMRTKDYKYERLAKEITKVTAIAYSLTALSGATFAFLMFGLYPDFAYYMINKFAPLWLIFYPGLFTVETILMYLYYYSWEPLKDRKGLHLTIGILLNIVGIATLFNMDAMQPI